MYVAPTARRHGAARALLEAALDHASTLPGVERLELGVTDAAPEAHALYLAAGFTEWAYEHDALRLGGGSTGLHSMVRTPRGAARGLISAKDRPR